MASEDRPPAGNQRRPRPPTVIDLEATEVNSGPVTSAAQSDAPDAAPKPDPVPEPEDAAIPPPPEQAAQAASEPGRSDPQSPPQSGSGRGPSAGPAGKMPWLYASAGIAGAAAGAVVVLLVLWQTGSLSFGRDPSADLNPRLAAIERQLHDLANRPMPAGVESKAIEQLGARLGKLETGQAMPRVPITDPVVLSRLSSSEQAMKSQADNVAALARRSDAVEAGLRDIQSRLARMSTSLDELRTAARSATAGSDRAARLALAVGSLRSAVERGDPFTAELAAIKPLTSDAAAVTALQPFAAGGVPNNVKLAQELTTLVKPLLNKVAAAPSEGSFLDRLQIKAESLVRVRPVGDAPGDDRDAILARIEQRAAQANVAGALTELAKLSPEARAPLQSWIAKADARNAAIEASRRLAAESIASLKAAP